MGDLTTSTWPSPAIEIVERVAEIEEQDSLDLPPLYDSVDPDALDRLAESSKIQFEYLGYNITVDSGTITIDQ
ncbi:HalOD1 output domain-containing protein [Natronosalvus amylolyticus]|uniref:HalOD1 output domain-containing protein n=1 Tax=Natronosalvus amylolyticus TaxID=2961994 RepID=UPI0020C9D805|nr:HalOD1 output domain-containing protein [Natronosalvus amylolyticus]